jgi:hypothetical protein
MISSCIKEDVSNLSHNITINQSFSIPFGPSSITIDKPLITDTSSIPGKYGSFYYDTNIYPSNSPYFFVTYDMDFNLRDKIAREQWIKRVVFHLLVENSFPTGVYSQVYIYGQDAPLGNSTLLDSLFVGGPVLIDAAVLNAQGDIEQTSSDIIDVPFDSIRLAMLEQANLLVYHGKISATGARVNPLRLSGSNKLSVNTALQVELQYNLNEANK